MKVTEKAQKRAERVLRCQNLRLEDIESFRFMERYTPVPEKHSKQNKYGPGLLTLKLKDGNERVVTLHARHHPSSVIRTLLAHGITFSNCRQTQAAASTLPEETLYRRPSLYLFWYIILLVLFFAMGFKMLMSGFTLLQLVLGCIFFLLAIYTLYLLQTRFCYLKLKKKELCVYSSGRKLHYPYTQLRKVNFDFARELNFTHVMEVLEQDYRYHLFYIGRVSRKQLREIATRLQQVGIDATCSLNDEKKHYHDIYHVQ